MTHSVFDRLWLRNEIPEKISRAFDPDILILVDWHTLWRIQPPHPPPLSPPLYRRLFILIYPYTMHTLWLVRVRLGDRVTSLTTLSLVSFILVHWLVKIFPTHTLVGPFYLCGHSGASSAAAWQTIIVVVGGTTIGWQTFSPTACSILLYKL